MAMKPTAMPSMMSENVLGMLATCMDVAPVRSAPMNSRASKRCKGSGQEHELHDAAADVDPLRTWGFHADVGSVADGPDLVADRRLVQQEPGGIRRKQHQQDTGVEACRHHDPQQLGRISYIEGAGSERLGGRRHGPNYQPACDQEPGDPVEHDRADDDVDAALDIEIAGDCRPCTARKHAHDDADGSMQELRYPAKAPQGNVHRPNGMGYGSPISKEGRYNGAYPELTFGADVEQATLECQCDRKTCRNVHGAFDE